MGGSLIVPLKGRRLRRGATMGFPNDVPMTVAVTASPLRDGQPDGWGDDQWRVDSWDEGGTDGGSSGGGGPRYLDGLRPA